MLKVELRVRNEGDDELIYTLQKPSEAAEIIQFLSDFWPNAQFVVQPISH